METNPIFVYSVAVFVAMGAISMVVQAVVSLRLYKGFQQMKEQVNPLIPQAQNALEEAQTLLRESRTQFREISSRTTAILDSAKNQMARVEDVVADAASRTKNQLDRTELIVQDTVSRVHETVSAVQGTILRPIREVNGLAAGVKAGLSQFIRGNRPSVDKVTQDEEMFI